MRPPHNFQIFFEDLNVHQKIAHQLMRGTNHPEVINSIFLREFHQQPFSQDSSMHHARLDFSSALSAITSTRELLDRLPSHLWLNRFPSSLLEGAVDIIFNLWRQREAFPFNLRSTMEQEIRSLDRHYDYFLKCCGFLDKTTPLAPIIRSNFLYLTHGNLIQDMTTHQDPNIDPHGFHYVPDQYSNLIHGFHYTPSNCANHTSVDSRQTNFISNCVSINVINVKKQHKAESICEANIDEISTLMEKCKLSEDIGDTVDIEDTLQLRHNDAGLEDFQEENDNKNITTDIVTEELPEDAEYNSAPEFDISTSYNRLNDAIFFETLPSTREDAIQPTQNFQKSFVSQSQMLMKFRNQRLDIFRLDIHEKYFQFSKFPWISHRNIFFNKFRFDSQ